MISQWECVLVEISLEAQISRSQSRTLFLLSIIFCSTHASLLARLQGCIDVVDAEQHTLHYCMYSTQRTAVCQT